jgi:tRNA (mo5U34)-methyltransferase
VTDDELKAAIAEIPYWYHAINLRPGITTPGWAPLDASMYQIPDDLTGKRVLDVGAWDGYWTFEALKRGAAHVTAIDDFSDTCGRIANADRSKAWQTFDLCANALGYKTPKLVATGYVTHRLTSAPGVHPCTTSEIPEMEWQKEDPKLIREELDIQFIDDYRDGEPLIDPVDVVLCFGVLYHLRHPLLALDNMRKVCRGTIHIETAILDNCQSAYDANKGYDGTECCAEFYPNDEYGMNKSNWHVGTLRYWCALVEAAGFKNIEAWRLTDNPKSLAECRGFIRATV